MKTTRNCVAILCRLFRIAILSLEFSQSHAADNKLQERFIGWRYAVEIQVENPSRQDRPREIVDVGLCLPATRTKNLQNDARVVLKNGFQELVRELPYQIYDLKTSGAYTTCRIAFNADLKAGGIERFAVFYDNPDAKSPPIFKRIKLRPEIKSLTVEATDYCVTLDGPTGQATALATRIPAFEELYRSTQGVFPLPTVVVPSVEGGAVSRLPLHLVRRSDEPDTYVEGCVFTAVRGRRYYQDAAGTEKAMVTFSYVFYGTAHHFLVATSLEFLRDVAVLSVENNPLTASKALFSHYLFRPVSKKLPLTDIEEIGAILVETSARKGFSNGDLLAGMLPADIAWQAIVNVDTRIAVTGFNLRSHTAAQSESGPFYRQSTRAYLRGDYLGWSNAPVHISQTSAAPLIVPRGTAYSDVQAVAFSEWNDNEWRSATDDVGRKLNTPLKVQVYPTDNSAPLAPDGLPHRGDRESAYLRGIR